MVNSIAGVGTTAVRGMDAPSNQVPRHEVDLFDPQRTVKLLGDFGEGGSPLYINASRVDIHVGGSQLEGGSHDVRQRCLGQTPLKPEQGNNAEAESNAQASPQEFAHVMTLLDEAQKLANANTEGQTTPQMMQFISPRAFNNPRASVDRALSDLIQTMLGPNQGQQAMALLDGYSIVSCKDCEPSPDAEGHNARARRFEVTYRVKDQNQDQKLILTEYAPFFKDGILTQHAIQEALDVIGDQDPQVMLSYMGIGRVAIMQVVLDVKAQLSQAGRTFNDQELEDAINAAIVNVENVRGKYISTKPRQVEAIREALKNLNLNTPKFMGASTDVQTRLVSETYAELAESASADTGKRGVPDTPITTDALIHTDAPAVDAPTSLTADADAAPVNAAPAAAAPAAAAPAAAPAATESPAQSGPIIPALHVPLAPLPLKNPSNVCFANSAIKFMRCWLGDHFKVNPDLLEVADVKVVEPFRKLHEELERLRPKLTAKQPQLKNKETPESLESFLNLFVSDDLAKAMGKGSGPDNPLKEFTGETQQDASEFIIKVTEALGVKNLQEEFNAPYREGELVLTQVPVRPEMSDIDQGLVLMDWREIKRAPDVKLQPPTAKAEKSEGLLRIKPSDVAKAGVPNDMRAWIEGSLNSQANLVDLDLATTLTESDDRINEELSKRIKSTAKEYGLDLSQAKFSPDPNLYIANALAPSKLALHLQPYTTQKIPQGADKDPIFNKKVFDLQPINLNEEILLHALDKNDNNKRKEVKYKPTAFVFHQGMTMENGHYFMLAKVQTEAGLIWMRHDDNKVRPLTDDEVRAFKSGTHGARPTLVLLQSVNSLPQDAAQPTKEVQSSQDARSKVGQQPANDTTTRKQSKKPGRSALPSWLRKKLGTSAPGSALQPDPTAGGESASGKAPTTLGRIKRAFK